MLRKVHKCCKVVGTDLGDEEIYNIPSKESSSQKDAVLVKKYTRKK